MSRPAWLRAIALLAVATLSTAACSHGPRKRSPEPSTTTTVVAATPTREVTIHPPIVVRGAAGRSAGASATVVARIRPSVDGKLHVGFTRTGVGATGVQWEAAGWGAVTVATLLTRAPLADREIDFDVTGPLDGTSAGALMTVAVIALIRGDHLLPGVTMTGAINPDGSIGPADGVPYKVDGAVAAHQTRLLIPEGQLVSRNDAGRLVDASSKGQRRGIQVTETSDIYDAYPVLTNQTLPRLPSGTAARLDGNISQRMQRRVNDWRAKYESALSDFHSLAPVVQQDLQSYATAAMRDERDSKDLTHAGLHAGAFAKAVNAAAFMSAIAHVGQAFPILLDQGVGQFVAQIKAGQSIPDEISALVKSLQKVTPESVGDMGALLAAYSDAVDAVSLSRTAQGLFTAPSSNADDARALAAQGAVYYELAGSLVEAAADGFLVGQGVGGAAIGGRVDKADLAHFFQRSAAANLDALRALVIALVARAQKSSVASVAATLAASDSTYAFARTGAAVLQSLPSYFGPSRTTDDAKLGGAISLYLRSAALLSKYSSLGRTRPGTVTFTGIANSGSFNATLQYAQGQLASNIDFLQANRVTPVTAVTDSELASVDQNGDANSQFDALGEYWNGYVNSRVLASFGGLSER